MTASPLIVATFAFDAALHEWLSIQIRGLLSIEPATVHGTRLYNYALISAGQCEDHAAATLVASHHLAYERLFMQTPEAELADIGPWLVEIPSQPDERLLRALAQQAAAQAMTLLCSPVRLPKLCEHLRSFMYGAMPDGSPVMLRYFDPRVGFEIFRQWPESVQQHFAMPLAWWDGWDSDLQRRHISGESTSKISPLKARIELSTAWCNAMDLTGEAHLIVALLAEELEESNHDSSHRLEQIHPVLRRQIAKKALAFSKKAGLVSWNNRAMACRHALLQHANFYQDPEFLSTLLDTGVNSLEAVLALVPKQTHADWDNDREQMLIRLYDELVCALPFFDTSTASITRRFGAD